MLVSRLKSFVSPFNSITFVANRGTALVLLISNYSQAGIGFALGIFIARSFSVEEFGILNLAIFLGNAVSVIVTFGADRTLVRDLCQSEIKNEIMIASIVLRAVVALVSILVVMFWVVHDPAWAGRRTPVIYCVLWGVVQSLYPQAWFDITHRMALHGLITLIERLLYALAVLLLFLGWPENAVPGMIALALLVSRLISFSIQWNRAGVNWSVLRSARSELVALVRKLMFGNLPIVAIATSNMILTTAIPILLERRAGPAELSQYSVALQLLATVQILQTQLVRWLAPSIGKVTARGVEAVGVLRQFRQDCTVAAIASATLTLPVFLMAGSLLAWFYGERYVSADMTLRVLAVWCTLLGPGMIVNQYLLGFHANFTFLVASLITGPTALVVSSFLIPKFGAVGVALILLICHGSSMLFQCIIVLERINTQRHK